MNLPAQITRNVILQRDVGPCTACGAKIGHACRRPSCPQLSPVGQAKPGPMPEVVRMPQCVAGGDPLRNPLHGPFLGVKLDKGWHALYPNLAASKWISAPHHLILVNSNNGDRFKISVE